MNEKLKHLMELNKIHSMKNETATNEELEEQLSDLSEYVDVLTEMLMEVRDDGN